MCGRNGVVERKTGPEKAGITENENLNPNQNTMKIQTSLLFLIIGAGTTSTLPAEQPERRTAGIPRSMERRDHRPAPPRPVAPAGDEQTMLDFPLETRTVDGAGNNLANPLWGSAETTVLRLAAIAYEDGVETPAGQDRASAREISNALFAQSGDLANDYGATDYLWQWGQFLDHDIIETPTVDPAEAFDIIIPAGDPFFDPTGSGVMTMGLNRSLYEEVNGVREQVNAITAFIDASNVYGSDDERSFALRALDGTGKLKTSDGDFLPFNEDGLPNAGGPGSNLFLAGDVRANEQVGLACMHTLFVREHNYWAETLAAADPTLGDEELYQMARIIVAGEMQAITYREFLPVLLGRRGLPHYTGYKTSVNPAISNEFGAAAYRVGHTMLSPTLLRIDENGSEITAGHLSLAGAFFRPDEVVTNGIDPVLRGLAAQSSQSIDARVIDEIRNFLFGPPGAGGFDLASLNIQRGRDHGIAGYNQIRVDFGLTARNDFTEISDDPEVVAGLASVYEDVDEIDAWVGMLAETHLDGAMVGETVATVLGDQFRRLRDGDRFYYKTYLPAPLIELVERQTLSKIIRRNTGIGDELPDNVFVPGAPVTQDWVRPVVRKKKKNNRRSRNNRRNRR